MGEIGQNRVRTSTPSAHMQPFSTQTGLRTQAGYM